MTPMTLLKQKPRRPLWFVLRLILGVACVAGSLVPYFQQSTLSRNDRVRAAEVARSYLDQEVKWQRMDDWGEPVAIRAGRGQDILVQYKTPAHEYQMVGTRSIRVDRVQWTAAVVIRK
jgi:hypothetical protein